MTVIKVDGQAVISSHEGPIKELLGRGEITSVTVDKKGNVKISHKSCIGSRYTKVKEGNLDDSNPSRDLK